MTLKEHLRKNIVLSLPVIIGQLGHIMVGVADSIMVGRLGVIPLAAATFAGTIYHILMLFGIGVSYAITPKVAAADVKNSSKLLRYLQDGFFMNLGLGLILFALGYFASHFLHYFGQEVPVAQAAGPYLVIMCGSLIPLMIFQTFRQYAEGLSDTFSPMIVSVFANLLNVFFNYMLIYGKLGAPALGLNGAGIATLMARVLMFALMIWWIRKKCVGFEWKFKWNGIKELLRIGVPSGMQYVFEVGAFATAAIMVGWISAEALAAHNIALNLAAISYMAATGLAAASTIRIGNQMGLKDRRNLRIAGFSSFGLVTIFMGTCAMIFIVFRNQLPALYIENEAVQQMASVLLIIAAAFQISDGVQAVGLGVLRGLQDVKIPTIITFVSYWLIAIPTGYVFAFILDWGVNGVWYALSLGLTIAGVFNMWRFNRLSKKIKFV
ncbi:multidrug resistance protein, MATE family [Ekhidna lutea]|uniref:Multidrug-efflux transporter n=1 Tax=Ekhidna lutea TaxID=447679 RepID=A0A239FK14_EKHLU|nr:MATE family efflux transporter [Ekhidna lutea]SNS57236.1 multidrug resistance protein, MATE family [Ekhidna lutea]